MIEFILTFVTLLLRTKDHEEKMRNIIQETLNIFTYNDKTYCRGIEFQKLIDVAVTETQDCE